MKQSFTMGMKGFFGDNGKGIKAFQDEMKALTHEDKEYFHKGLASQGVDCLAPVRK